MTPERFALLKEVLLTARRLPAGEREAYIAEVSSGDAELRDEIDSLLRQDSASFAVLKSFRLDSIAVTGADPPLPRPLPEWVGPYRVLGILGEGGMGVVYRAEQLEPIHREVALKLVRPGHDSQRIAARFESERQTLARMEHPHITRVFDAGTAADGSPYFAMELVRGMPITDYCREHRLPLRRRLELFQAVCRAVQHAHQKGVIHRDLKPSNLLVETHDGEPVPKVIDFGISKAMEVDVAATTGMTRDGQLMGTLEYMSPEQARGRLGEVDTRSDVYSLGVVLYELVTGELPHGLSRLSIPEALHAILEEPPKPFRRRATSERLDPDIETIVRKALEKTPDRRYEGAGALADDLQRFLRSEPITARPASKAYQLRKLVARHRAPFAALVTSTALVLAFGIVMAVMFGIQTRERKRSEREQQKAEATLAFLHAALAASNPGEGGGAEVTVREMLDAARRKLDAEAPTEPEVEIAVRVSLANTYSSISRGKEAEEQLRLALLACERVPGDRVFDHALVLQDLGAAIWYQGAARHAEAESLWAEAVRIRRKRTGDKENDENVAGLLNNIAASRGQRDPAGAEPLLRESIAMSLRLHGEAFTFHSLRLGNLAMLQEKQGRLDEAEATLREKLRIGSGEKGDESRAALAASQLAELLSQRGKYDEAESLLVHSIASLDRIYGHDLNQALGNARRDLGILRYRRGAYASGESLLGTALGIFDRMVAVGSSPGPSTPHIRTATALGEVLAAQEQFAAADSVLEGALRSAREQSSGVDDPLVASILKSLAHLRRMQGRISEADALLREAADYLGPELARTSVRVPGALALLDLGMLHLDAGRPRDAESVLRRCLEELGACGRAEWWPAAVAKNELACALIMAGGPGKEAEELWAESRATLVDHRSPVAFGVRQRALEHTVRALGADGASATDYASALGRM